MFFSFKSISSILRKIPLKQCDYDVLLHIICIVKRRTALSKRHLFELNIFAFLLINSYFFCACTVLLSFKLYLHKHFTFSYSNLNMFIFILWGMCNRACSLWNIGFLHLILKIFLFLICLQVNELKKSYRPFWI